MVPIKKKKDENQNRSDIGPIVEQADRFGLSVRATAAVATATLNAFGIVSNKNNQLAIDKSKVHQQLRAKREDLRNLEITNLK